MNQQTNRNKNRRHQETSTQARTESFCLHRSRTRSCASWWRCGASTAWTNPANSRTSSTSSSWRPWSSQAAAATTSRAGSSASSPCSTARCRPTRLSIRSSGIDWCRYSPHYSPGALLSQPPPHLPHLLFLPLLHVLVVGSPAAFSSRPSVSYFPQHRGNTFLTSLPSATFRHHGRLTQSKSRYIFTPIFLVHNSCCDKCI